LAQVVEQLPGPIRPHGRHQAILEFQPMGHGLLEQRLAGAGQGDGPGSAVRALFDPDQVTPFQRTEVARQGRTSIL
jgi:hypothetical protein